VFLALAAERYSSGVEPCRCRSDPAVRSDFWTGPRHLGNRGRTERHGHQRDVGNRNAWGRAGGSRRRAIAASYHPLWRTSSSPLRFGREFCSCVLRGNASPATRMVVPNQAMSFGIDEGSTGNPARRAGRSQHVGGEIAAPVVVNRTSLASHVIDRLGKALLPRANERSNRRCHWTRSRARESDSHSGGRRARSHGPRTQGCQRYASPQR
jgi:hypothetical protein